MKEDVLGGELNISSVWKSLVARCVCVAEIRTRVFNVIISSTRVFISSTTVFVSTSAKRSLDPRPSLLLCNKKGWEKEEDGLGNRLASLMENGMFTPQC